MTPKSLSRYKPSSEPTSRISEKTRLSGIASRILTLLIVAPTLSAWLRGGSGLLMAQTYAAPNESASSSVAVRPVGGAVAIPTGQHKRTKREWIFLAVGVGAAEWDVASTYSLFRREPGEYHELNPLQRPFVDSGLGYLTAPTDVSASWFIATHVRGKWKRRAAWAVFWGSTAAHLYAASRNYTLH